MQVKKSPIFHVLTAAILFGASAPLAKLLLGEIQPVVLAAFLYLGSGIGLFIYKIIRHILGKESKKEARLQRKDFPWLFGSVLSGGVAAPIVLMFSLKHTPASTASLLLNFESVATTLVAALAFHEAVGKRVWSAVAFVTIASVLLSLDATGEWGFSLGAVGILVACVLWGIDNNFARNISSKDPIDIVIIKGIAAGFFSLILALILGDPLPGLRSLLLSSILGLFSYGLSIVFFILAMRDLGSARTSAYFASAPFIGAAISFIIFREPPNILFIISLPILIAGVFLLFGERHSHTHTHFEIEHEHMHSHEDGHHSHTHLADDGNKVHSHLHKHEGPTHKHPHAPDIHHRHDHEK